MLLFTGGPQSITLNRTCNSPDIHLSYWEYDSKDDLDNMVKPKSSSDVGSLFGHRDERALTGSARSKKTLRVPLGKSS